MPLPDGTPTAKEIKQHYRAAMDSVALIQKLEAKGGLDEEEQDTLERNKAHLRYIVDQDFWTDEDLTPLVNASGGTPTPTKVLVDRIKRITQKHLDDFAQTGDYDSIDIACTFALSGKAKMKAEGQYAVTLRDDTWTVARQVIKDIRQGTIQPPTREEFIAMLPVANWP